MAGRPSPSLQQIQMSPKLLQQRFSGLYAPKELLADSPYLQSKNIQIVRGNAEVWMGRTLSSTRSAGFARRQVLENPLKIKSHKIHLRKAMKLAYVKENGRQLDLLLKWMNERILRDEH